METGVLRCKQCGKVARQCQCPPGVCERCGSRECGGCSEDDARVAAIIHRVVGEIKAEACANKSKAA